MALFDHYFDPPTATSLGSTIDLTTREIEDAGVREVLQTPGAALGSWSILDALLAPGGDFTFSEPLGKAREVKTAISGLFGRFVARAYAERYLQLPNFAHLYADQMWFDRRRRAEVRRIAGQGGDLPDWVAWSPRGTLAIVEAKGCYSGSNATLNRAYTQAERVEILVRGRVAPFKRYAIVSQWYVASSGANRSKVKVKDPDNDASPLDEDDARALGIGVARRHFASLLRPLGHVELSDLLLRLVGSPLETAVQPEIDRAMTLMDQTPARQIRTSSRREPLDPLIGGFVTRAGPLADAGRLSELDMEVLSRLDLGPTFIGVERRAILATIKGDADMLEREQIEEVVASPEDRSMGPSTDNGGTWIVRMGKDDAELGPPAS